MRRSTAVIAAVAVAAGCQDRHQPMGPGPLWNVEATPEYSGNPHVWIVGRSVTLSDGTVCRAVDDERGFGMDCDNGEFYNEFEFNATMAPVVEVCRLNPEGVACVAGEQHRAVFRDEIGVADTTYFLHLKDQDWWQAQGDGVYRIMVGISAMGWDTQSDKLLGYYDLVRNSANSNHKVKFRIRKGAFCDGGPDGAPCAETSYDPIQPGPIVFDEDYDLSDSGTGIIGLQFPPGITQKINIIIQKIALQDGERCITEEKFEDSPFAPGRELAPCYNIRTEPYIDLGALSIGAPIQFAMCLDSSVEDSNEGGLLRMLKWSSVKNEITDVNLWFDQLASFFSCPDDFVVAAAPMTGWSRFAATTTRLLRPLRSLAGPQPVYASYRIVRSPANGSLMDFSRIVVEADDHYEAAFLSPVGSADPMGPDNELQVAPTVEVHVCLLVGADCATPSTSPAPPNSWAGEATWNPTSRHYQVNWNTPRNQATGTYRITFKSGSYMIISPEHINITFGTASYTHNAGRTLPLKFYLKRP
jgi:hypothetical protein